MKCPKCKNEIGNNCIYFTDIDENGMDRISKACICPTCSFDFNVYKTFWWDNNNPKDQGQLS